MTFHDMPQDHAPLALDDAEGIAETLDLLVPLDARAQGALLVLLCDHEHRPLQPLLIDDLSTMPLAQMPRMLAQLADQVLGVHGITGDLTALVAIARPGPLVPNGTDRRWAREIVTAFRDRVPILGIHLMTFDGSVPLPERRRAA